MIPLQNPEGQHLGFLLHAGIPGDFASSMGQWEGDCIFRALPRETELLEDPSFIVLASHRDAGEHRVILANDGARISLIATASDGAQLFVRLPGERPGAWGILSAGSETPLGLAVRVSKPSA